jgi:IS5 family transposase
LKNTPLGKDWSPGCIYHPVFFLGPELGSAEHEETLSAIGIKIVALRIRRRKLEYGKEQWYKRLQRFRAGIEGTISLLKRKYGLKRSLYKGTAGNRQWVGLESWPTMQRVAKLV